MPRPRKPSTERWVSDIPTPLAQRANALRAHHIKWFSKALFIEMAMTYYCEVAERDGLESLPPFRLTKPDSPKIVGPPSGSGMEHKPSKQESIRKMWSEAPANWQEYLRTG